MNNNNNDSSKQLIEDNLKQLLQQLGCMLSPGDTDSSPLASAPTVIREAASHDFAQYRFLFPPSLVQPSDESGSAVETSDESRSGSLGTGLPPPVRPEEVLGTESWEGGVELEEGFVRRQQVTRRPGRPLPSLFSEEG